MNGEKDSLDQLYKWDFLQEPCIFPGYIAEPRAARSANPLSAIHTDRREGFGH
jgi:hypothetical protein